MASNTERELSAAESDGLSKTDIMRLNMLLAKQIGTPAQRNAVKRILTQLSTIPTKAGTYAGLKRAVDRLCSANGIQPIKE